MFDILIGPVRVCRVPPPPRVYRFPPRDKPADDCRVSRYTDVVVYARPSLRLLRGVLSFFFVRNLHGLKTAFLPARKHFQSNPMGGGRLFSPVVI